MRRCCPSDALRAGHRKEGRSGGGVVAQGMGFSPWGAVSSALAVVTTAAPRCPPNPQPPRGRARRLPPPEGRHRAPLAGRGGRPWAWRPGARRRRPGRRLLDHRRRRPCSRALRRAATREVVSQHRKHGGRPYACVAVAGLALLHERARGRRCCAGGRRHATGRNASRREGSAPRSLRCRATPPFRIRPRHRSLGRCHSLCSPMPVKRPGHLTPHIFTGAQLAFMWRQPRSVFGRWAVENMRWLLCRMASEQLRYATSGVTYTLSRYRRAARRRSCAAALAT